MSENLDKEIQLILNGHNEHVNKIEPYLTETLANLVSDTKGKSGEELAGIMNYHYMELTTLMRKAAAIGYQYCLDHKDKP